MSHRPIRLMTLSRKTKIALAVILTIAMVLGSVPTGALQAMAEELGTPSQATDVEMQSDDQVPAQDDAVVPEDADAADETPQPVLTDPEVVPAEDTSTSDVDDPTAPAEPAQGDDSTNDQTDLVNPAEPEPEPEAEPEPIQLIHEGASLRVTVDAPANALPEGAYVEAEEIQPVTEEKADAYGEALSALSKTLRADDQVYSDAKVYDIRIMDAEGYEIEPGGNVTVRMEYLPAQPVGDASDQVEVAHVTSGGDIEMMAAAVETTTSGAVEATEFVTDSFSYYIVFGTNEGSDTEPVHFGDYGWLKFATNGKQDTTTNQNDPTANWGHYYTADQLPATNTEEGYHRILQVRLHTLNTGGNETAYDTDYTLNTTNEYFWTWENSVYISDFYVPGYEVVQTKMHTAWDDPGNDVWQDSLVGSYNVRGYRSSDGTESELNILDVYMKDVPTPENAMRYIIRYVHADGSVTDGNVRYLPSGNTGDIDVNKPRDGEVFSGIAVAAGAEAVTANTANKTVRFTYDSKVNLAKAYVYFEKEQLGNATSNPNRYDKVDGKYYNKEKGLYTDKTAEKLSDRQFMVNLEAWYVDNGASVGMVLDASGSMAWTAGVPTEYELSVDELNNLIPNWRNYYDASHPLSLNDVNKLLDIDECDNSNNGYNGYKYFVYTHTIADTNPINEYAALGYLDNPSGSTARLGRSGSYKGTVDTRNVNGSGWYFVNSGTTYASFRDYGGKRYEGLNSSYWPNQSGPSRFWIANENGKYVLKCLFCQGTVSGTYNNQTSTVYIKRDQMMTKAETLQDSLAQFGSILNGYSPESEMAMVRYSHTNFPNNLTLLRWTNESEKMAAAMDLVPNAAGGYQRPDNTYQYGITGGTKARFGFNEYNSQLKPYADANNYKYLILFTDGKDQGTSDTERTTRAWLESTFPGYTIITMFMRSVGMSDSDVATSRTFLQGLASGGKNGNPNEKLYYEARSDNANEVVDQFREIAEHIVTGLQNYSVRDYIDPRFDVINDAGDVLSVLDSSGNFTSATNPDVDAQGFRGFTTPDGKQAKLGYDKTKKMFYVIWQNQDIQASPIGADTEDSTVTPWQSKIRLQAKEDFLGGNDVLTNGNSPTDNLVYKPQTTGQYDADGNPIPQYDSNGLERVDTSRDRKSFPYATVNPALLEIELENYEDTIFLGETISPGNLFYKVANATGGTKAETKARSAWTKLSAARKRQFWASLTDEDKTYYVPGWAEMTDEERAAISASTDVSVAGTDVYSWAMQAYADKYKAELSEGKWYINYLSRLGEHLHGDSDFYKKFINSGVVPNEGTQPTPLPVSQEFNSYDPSVETLTVEGDTLTIQIPYYYLQDPNDDSVYAGPNNGSMTDRVGTLTYTWTLHELAGNAIIDGTVFSPYDTYVDAATHMNVNKSVQYQLRIEYEPVALSDDAKNGDDGSQRTRALTGLPAGTALIRNVSEYRDNDGNIIYGDDAEFDDEQFAVEGKQTTVDHAGWAVIHAVDGRILVEKKIKTSDLELIDSYGLDGTMTFTLTGAGIGLKTTANQPAGEPAEPVEPQEPQEPEVVHFVYDESGDSPVRIPLDEVVWEKTIDLSTAERTAGTGDDADYTFITIPGNWATGLPMGEYTLVETCTGAIQKKSITSADVVFNGSSDPARPYNSTAANWAAPTTGNLTIKIGMRDIDGNKPSVSSYKSSNYTYAKVVEDLYTGTYKQVELIASYNKGKAYLNAQLGHAMVENELKPTRIDVNKTWEDADAIPTDSIVIKLTGSDDSVFYVPLTASTSQTWSGTTGEIIPLTGATYTAEEGTGTCILNEDTGIYSCSDFEAFGSTFTLHVGSNEKQFIKTGETYSDVVDTVTTGSDSVAVAVDEGATLSQATLTVSKTWPEEYVPTQGIVVRLTGDDAVEADPENGVEAKEATVIYVALAARDDATWKANVDLAAAGITDDVTFTAVQGTGTVAQNGSCTDFVPFEDTYELSVGDNETHTFTNEPVALKAAAQTVATGDHVTINATPLAGTVSFTNAKMKTQILIKKTNANSGAPLEGAKFILRDAEGNAIAGQTEVTTTLTQNGAAATALITNLMPSTTYQIEETYAPEGYQRRSENIVIKVDANGAVTLDPAPADTTDTKVPQITPAADVESSGIYELTVPNPRTYALPAAGGPGAYPFLLAGAFAAAYAAGGASDERRRLNGLRASRRAAGPLGGD